jgi:PAS domain S-box-containing protein
MLGPLEDVLAGGRSSDLALIDTAHRNGLRLLKLVNKLLDFSRIEVGRAQASYEPVDLAALTADLASSFRSAIERAGLNFVVTTPPLPRPVHVDRDMWEKVVLNLLSNAFKFNFEGGIAVTLAPSPDGSAAVLEVRDTGTGIPAEELPRLFERFHRVAGARGRTFEGSGIGLALVQELVNLHGGTIAVESEEGRGSAFVVSLPFGTAHLPPDRINAERPVVSSAVRAQAYVEEALRWLPGSAAGPGEDENLLPADDLGLAALAAPAAGGGRVLLADDNADMRDYVRRLLAGQGYGVEAVGDGEAALAAAQRQAPDLVLSDVMMPRLDGFGLLRALRGEEALRDVPIILLSARAGEESRVAGVDAGADDYLTKPFSARELLARVGANLALARARREALETLRGLNATLEARVAERTRERDSMWRLSRELMVVARPDGTTLAVNPACIDTLGWAEDELLGPGFRDLVHPDDRTATMRENESLGAGRATPSFENRLRHRDGSYRWIVWTAVPQEGIVYAVGRDVTEARATEERLRQAQKMETIGQLTGGVAHDFNNLLTVVCGNLETIQRDAARLEGDGPSSRVRRAADNAMRGAQRAAVLTQRLLAFSRQQPLDPRTVNANRLVAGMSDLLSRTLGEHVEIETVLGGGLWLILADPNQLENALLNLAVNARDAMPGGGKLTIETANTHLNELYADDNAEVVAGQYVQIAVSDTGAGMPRAVMAQAFEPFFTTKDAGHGTGLGLSQVYGFVKQSGGHVKLYSEVGQGTTVKIYLPRLMTGKEEGEAEEERESPLPRGEPAEVVLVVEDDADVRLYSAELIRELGYRVLEAPTGPAGLELLEREAGVVSLLFTDVGLPGGMNGRQLADAARALRPGLPVLFTTGYARNAIVHGGRLDPGLQLINKPFTRAALAAKLREVLDAAAAPARVLLVEDDALIRMVAVEMLAEAGFQVEEAGNAGEALAKARAAGGRLAAAVVDFNLPDRPADELAAELRAIRSDLPLVVASGYGEAELRRRFGDASRLAFVAKPYNGRALVEALRGLGVKVPGPRAAPS